MTDWMKRLQKLEGAVKERSNPHTTVVSSPSPSVNFIFGNGWGLPFGYSAVIFGPPKGGKTLLSNAMIGQMHKDYPEYIAVKFNTEMREEGQLSVEEDFKTWGIDPNRYIACDINTPAGVFDQIEKDINAMCQDGAPVKLIIIDSLNQIQGRRSMNADSVDVQQIGDEALTIQTGLKRILPIIRKHRIALIITSHVRAEMDRIEQMRGHTTRMATSWATQHFAEYFIYVEQNKSKDGKTTLSGEEFIDKNMTDLMDKGDRLGHKIRVCMRDSSCGPKGRVGEFTLHYQKGIINTHEEVFLLGLNRGLIQKPNNMTYLYKNQKWVGQSTALKAIESSPEIYNEILRELRRMDVDRKYNLQPVAAPSIIGESLEG
jgi:RecA/RadA recombinase